MTQTMQRPPMQTAAAQPVYEITEADKKRQQAIENAWKAYKGELDPPLQKMPDQPDDNVMSNRVKPAVRSGNGFLFGKELEISVEKTAPKEAQDFLNTTWGRKEQRIPLLQELAMNGAMSGEAFLRIVPSEDDDGTFELVAIDPSTIFPLTAPQNCKTVLLYCIQYSVTQTINGQKKQVFYREEIQRIGPDGEPSTGKKTKRDTWEIQHWTQIGTLNLQPKNTNWTPAGEPYTWPYPFPPIFACQNQILPNDFWGEPDVTPDLIGMNNALNLDLSDINRVEKIYGGPIVYAPGLGEGVIDIAPGKIIKLPLPENKLEAVQIHSDVANALLFSKDLRSDMDELTRTPGVATGRIEVMPRGNLSGIAIELLFQSELMKTEEKRCTYGEMIIDVSQALLVLNHMSGDIDITLSWQSPLPHRDLASAQYAVTLGELGVSKQTRLEELGYDWEEEQKRSAEERTLDAQVAAQATAAAQAMLPPELPGAPLLPGQPPPAQPGMPAQPGQPMPVQGGMQK
jgi:hypothetical protein